MKHTLNLIAVTVCTLVSRAAPAKAAPDMSLTRFAAHLRRQSPSTSVSRTPLLMAI